ARHDLPDELSAGLDLTVQPSGKLLRVLARRRADDQVAPASHDVVALLLQPVRERVCVIVRRALDPDLPRRVALLAELLLPRLVGRLVVPAPLAGQPVFEPNDQRLEARLVELGLDDVPCLPRLEPRRRVDEDRFAVPRDGEPGLLELLGQLAGARAEVEPE